MSTNVGNASRRSSGLLLHVTSLPGPYGVGDFGPPAWAWLDQLAAAGQTWWQVLPLAPAGDGDSPYQAFSAFAGDPILINPELLVMDHLLQRRDILKARFPADVVDYAGVRRFKDQLFAQAWHRFATGAAPNLAGPFQQFRAAESWWLDDFALFTALKAAHPGVPWNEWPRPIARRRPEALRQAASELRDRIERACFVQFLFARQLQRLREYAHARGVRLIGDLPIFVSPESADVWSHPRLFRLDRHLRPKVVAGVPPDYFSATGQRWGNPLYDWKAMRAESFTWWVQRLRAALRQADLVRIDHFRGFAGCWEIPAAEPTAVKGRWIKGPGAELFQTLQREMGELPFIAEDLGVITPDVVALRDQFALPGMRVLQFGFGGDSDNPHLPHNFTRNTIAYTGTHDNDTTRGWRRSLSKEQAAHLRQYAPETRDDPTWGLLRLAWSSIADIAIAPAQDVLGLGSRARMNVPGRPSGNWNWRMRKGTFTPALVRRLNDLTATYGRRPNREPKP